MPYWSLAAMMSFLYSLCCILLLQLSHASPVSAGPMQAPAVRTGISQHLQGRTVAACVSLSDALPQRIYWPNTTEYSNESQNVWSQTCVKTPQCVFEPLNASELSQGLQLIRTSGSQFAFRAGGHMPVPGAQSLDNGVMISASTLNMKELSADQTVASIGPGQTWMDVYNWLVPYGLAVNGGRFPSVGIGGVLVGGGMGYFSGSQGWAADNIVGWQVVLWNGTILEITNSAEDPHADLAWALKGGSNFFGLVTRFDVLTFPVTGAFGGLTTWSSAAGPEFFQALTSYMAPGGGVDDPNVHADAFAGVSFNNGTPALTYYNIALYPGDNTNPTALQNFTAIASETVVANGVAMQESWTAVPEQLSPFSTQALRDIFYAVSFKATEESISLYNTTVIDNAISMLSHVEGIQTYAVYQPVSQGYLQVSKDKGGNVLGLDPDVDGTFVAGIIMCMWANAEDDATVLNFAETSAQQFREKMEPLGLTKDFIYLGDSAQGQLPLGSYAGGASLDRLKSIQEKYDPEGFLEKYLHRGFPLA